MVWIFVMKSRDTWGGRSPDSWLIHDHQFFLKGKVLTYSPQLPYWDIRVSQTTFTQLGQLWQNEQIMPAPRRSPNEVLTQPSDPEKVNCWNPGRAPHNLNWRWGLLENDFAHLTTPSNRNSPLDFQILRNNKAVKTKGRIQKNDIFAN